MEQCLNDDDLYPALLSPRYPTPILSPSLVRVFCFLALILLLLLVGSDICPLSRVDTMMAKRLSRARSSIERFVWVLLSSLCLPTKNVRKGVRGVVPQSNVLVMHAINLEVKIRDLRVTVYL